MLTLRRGFPGVHENVYIFGEKETTSEKAILFDFKSKMSKSAVVDAIYDN